MRTVVIEDMGEYSNRLIRYLERELPPDTHVIGCHSLEEIRDQLPTGVCCVGRNEFIKDADEKCIRKILISENAGNGQFCIFHSPARLIPLIEESFLRQSATVHEQQRETVVTAIYMPVFEPLFREIALEIMDEGAICIGMENLGGLQEDQSDTGDLCYYIHLHKENLARQVKEMSQIYEDKYFLDSPCIYYDLLELGREDFRWFLEQMRQSKVTEHLYVAMGSGVVKDPEIFRDFDRVIVLCSDNNPRLQRFCNRFRQILEVKEIHPRGGVEFLGRELFIG